MRVVSLFLPRLPIERLRRREPASAQPERRQIRVSVDDDPGACSVPQGGGWRPGARWARQGATGSIDAEPSAAPQRARSRPRELGRRSEAAPHPFRSACDGNRLAGGAAPTSADVHPANDRPPLAVVGRVGRREEVVACCVIAAAGGVDPGMPATHARALLPGLEVRPADPVGDAALLERLALHAVRHWAPTAAPSGSDGLWIDLTGAAHLHGGERRFAARLVAFCARLGLTARVAVADTPGCAHAAARFGRDAVAVVPPGGSLAALVPLPVAALRLDGPALAAARRFGFERIGDMLPIPRAPLARRLGMTAVVRLDQAMGSVAEPIASVVDAAPPVADLRLLEPIGAPEQIDRVVTDLVAALVAVLRERGLGARAVRLVAVRVDGVDQAVAIGTSRPTREPAHILRLLRLRLDRIDPGLGLEGFSIVAERCEPLAASAIGGLEASDRRDPAGLVDAIASRVGVDRVFRIGPVASHVPERAVARIPPLALPHGWPGWSRPARLLARPEPLAAVIALLPDQPPRRLEWRGRGYRVTSADGPERIHGEWWRREAETWGVRDYYRIEDDAGGRWWIFRRGDGVDAATGDLSWWMHGAG